MPSLQTELFTPAWTIIKTAGYQQNNYNRTSPTESKMILRTEKVRKISFTEDYITGKWAEAESKKTNFVTIQNATH